MNIQEIWSIAGAIIASVGGAGIIICAVSGFVSARLAQRIDKKYEQRLEKELERYKLSLEKHRHITKAQFDREFEIYHQLSKSFFSMIVSLSSFTNRTLELNECPQDNRKIIVDNITRMIDKTGMAQNVLYENSAFIPKDIFELYDAIYENANDLFWCYEKKSLDYASGRIDIANLISEDNKVTAKEIEHNFYIASAKLREYLGTLAIVE